MADRPPVRNARAQHPTQGASKLADIAYEGFFMAAVGGAAVALFFLLADSFDGRPLHTPSVLGGALFSGIPPEAVAGVRLDLVAYFSLIHFAAFGSIGLSLSILANEFGLHARRPSRIVFWLFLVLEGGFLGVSLLTMPAVPGAIGHGRIVVGNMLAAVAMTLFMVRSHNPEGWQRILEGKPAP